MKTAEPWAKRNECKILLIVILLFPAVHIYLLTLQLRLTFGYSFLVVLLVTKFVLGAIAYKNGWIKRTPKQRRIIYTLTSGVVVSLGTTIVWRQLTGPLPAYSFPVFILLFAMGALLSDKVWKKLEIY
jgi:uncharacterized YccA/Bax inhibitor family protein